jgi:GTPase
MRTIKALIKLYEGDGVRKTPFISGYRPIFDFKSGMKTSGQITLIDGDQFAPGNEGIVEIKFANPEYLGADFGKGKKFKFSENGHNDLGEGEVIDVLD